MDDFLRDLKILQGAAKQLPDQDELLAAIDKVARLWDTTREWAACLRCSGVFPTPADLHRHYATAH